MASKTAAKTETEIAHENGLHYGVFHSWCPACIAQKEQDAADRDKENAAEIDRLTCDFAGWVDDALNHAREAHGAVEKLVSNQVYDVEMAEGPEGADALAELDTALRALRNAKRIADWRRSMMLADPALEG